MPTPDASRRAVGRWLLLANVFAGLLLAVLVALALQASRDAYARRAQDATERIAITLQQAIAADLQQADMALRSVQAVWRHAADQRLPAAQLAQMLADQRELNPELQGLLVTDAQGIVRQGRSADAASDLSGRALFRRARDDAAAAVLVSDPLRGSDDQPWSIMLARRLQHADGSFDGVVACQLAVGRFERMFAGIQLGEEGAITLRTDSLQLVARHTSQGPRSQDVGSTQVSRQLIDALRVDPARGFFVSRTALDGVERTAAYRRVEGFPLLVLVGLGTREFFAPWRIQLAQMIALVVLAMGAMTAASALMVRSWRRDADSARALVTEGRRNQALLRTASDGIHVLSRDGRVEELSESFAVMLGRTRDELLGQHVSAWDTQLSPAAIEHRLRTLPVGESARVETRHRRADGVEIDVDLVYGAVQIDGRELIYCSARDVTERNRLLREQRAMLDNDLVGIVKVKDRRYVWHNKAMQRIFGYSADELNGMSARKLYPSEHAYRAAGEAAYAVLRAGGRYRAQQEMVRKNGERVWIDSKGEVLSADGSESLWLLHDITALKQAEETQLKAVQLQAENRQLREANRLKGVVLGNMSHELRTPLNAIIGFAQLLRSPMAADDAQRDAYLKQIHVSGRQLLGLIDSVLQYSQVDSGQIELRPEPVDLTVLLAEVASVHDAERKAKRISLVNVVDPTLRDVVLDPLRLQQVLSALLSNAIKFTPEGGEVVMQARDDAEGLRIEVADSGIGIAEADLPRLFQPFRQLSEGLTKRFGGMGIGLALARSLVEAQGGRIGVTSTPGRGSVFFVVLPRVRHGATVHPAKSDR